MSGVTDENQTTTTMSPRSDQAKHIIKTSSTQSRISEKTRSPFRDRTLLNVFPEPELGRRSPKQPDSVKKQPPTAPSPLQESTAPPRDTTVRDALRQKVDAAKKLKEAKQKELRGARARTAAMRKELKNTEDSIQRAKIELKSLPAVPTNDSDDNTEHNIEQRIAKLKSDMDDNQEMLQEFNDIMEQGADNERDEEEAEINHLMNAIPEKQVYIQELKEKL